MIYDTHPPYAHQAHLPYAREPWKGLYVFQRLTTTILLVPYWAVYYSFFSRPQPTWSIRQCIFVNFTRRIYKVTEVAGVTWGTRNPEKAPKERSLKETRFEWIDPLEEILRTGIICLDPNVHFKRVGVFIWPKVPPTPTLSEDRKVDTWVDLESASSGSDTDPCLIGIFFHGGGYCHMSAHEKSRTSRIPRRLVKDKRFSEIYSVEYRLLQFAPFPAVIQDAAAVYAHIVHKYVENPLSSKKYKIVLLGDSSGGNLALALARWIRDEAKLPAPAGLLLFSPSCDTSHAFPETASSYIPRPHSKSDYLVDTPEPRALLQRTFLGFKYRPSQLGGLEKREGDIVVYENTAMHDDEEQARLMRIVHSEYVSPASPQVLKRWGHPVDPVSCATRDFTSSKDSAVAFAHPCPDTKLNAGLFTSFPRTLVVLSTHERLTHEVGFLTRAMRADGVDIDVEWAEEGVHDICIIAEGWWDETVIEGVWKRVGKWVTSV